VRREYFSENNLAKLHPEVKTYEVLDAAEKTLKLRVHPSGERVFYFRNTRNHFVLGKWPSMPCEEARSLACRMVEAEKSGLTARRILNERLWFKQTVADLFEKYLEIHLKVRASKKTYDGAAKGYHRALGVLADKPINEVSSLDVQKWVNHLAETKGAPSSKRWFTLLQAALRFCDLHGLIELRQLPTAGVKTVADNERTAYLSPEKFPVFIEAVNRLDNRDHAEIILMLLYTGLRKSVVLNMQWEHINLGAAQWQPPKGNTTKKVPPAVALVEPAMEILRRRQAGAGSAFVFGCERSSTGHIMNIRDSFKAVTTSAGLSDDFVIHSLRHSAITAAAMAGATVLQLQQCGGWASPRMAARYAHLNTDSAREALTNGFDYLAKEMPLSTPSVSENVVAMRLVSNNTAPLPVSLEPIPEQLAPEQKPRAMSLLTHSQIIQIKAKVLYVAQQHKNGRGQDLYKRDFFRKLGGSQFGSALNAESLSEILDEMETEGLIESWRQPGSWSITRYRLPEQKPAEAPLQAVARLDTENKPSHEWNAAASAL
jgi:integrase